MITTFGTAELETVSALGQERRPLQWTAALQLPLCFGNDRDRAAMQYVAKGQYLNCQTRLLTVQCGLSQNPPAIGVIV